MRPRHAVLEHQPRQAQQDRQPRNLAHGPFDFSSPWMDTETAAAYLNYRGPGRLESVYRFVKTNGIAIRRRSVRSILIAKADIDRALTLRRIR